MTVLLAKPYDGRDPTGWWMSEKLDGVRAVWRDGELRSRNGNVFYPPFWWRDTMPPWIALDGELFMGRGRFQDTVSIVRQHAAGEAWRDVKFVAFDLPDNPWVFELRQEALRSVDVKAASPYLASLLQHQCTGAADLKAYADYVHALGGEGVMLREPGSLYERKRSSTLLKVKRFHDLEAVVTGHVPGKGKHAGRMGALSCVFFATEGAAKEEGIRFEVGTGFTDAQRAAPPPVGSIITVRYQELTRDGVPRFPVYVGPRDYE